MSAHTHCVVCRLFSTQSRTYWKADAVILWNAGANLLTATARRYGLLHSAFTKSKIALHPVGRWCGRQDGRRHAGICQDDGTTQGDSQVPSFFNNDARAWRISSFFVWSSIIAGTCLRRICSFIEPYFSISFRISLYSSSLTWQSSSAFEM